MMKSKKGKKMAKKQSKLPVTSFYSRYMSGALIAVVAFGLIGTGYVFGSQAAPGTSKAGELAMIGNPVYGSTITINAKYSGVRKNENVRLQVICLQNGSVVYSSAKTLTGSPSSNQFTLGVADQNSSSVWKSGSASCRSDMFVIAPGSSADPYYLTTLNFEAPETK